MEGKGIAHNGTPEYKKTTTTSPVAPETRMCSLENAKKSMCGTAVNTKDASHISDTTTS